jgi:S1-C subfamily serine protease
MRIRSVAVTLLSAGVLGFAALPSAQSAEERAAARDVVTKKGDAVVMVMGTLKIRANVDGREQIVDQQAQGNGTVLDASGLTVLSLSTLQPDEMMSRSLSARMRPGTRVDVSSEPSGIRMHLADGRELPSRLVLRDEDLDLAFVRPVEPPSAPLTWIDAPAATPALLDLLFVIQRTSEASGWSTAATFGNVQLVVDKPRLYYQVAMVGSGGGSLGSPVFDAAGRFVGVVVMRNSGARGPSATGVLPAEDILDVAKQAQ